MKTKVLTAALISFFALQIQICFAQNTKRDLNKNIFFIVEAKIKPGQFQNFVRVAKEMSEVVINKESRKRAAYS